MINSHWAWPLQAKKKTTKSIQSSNFQWLKVMRKKRRRASTAGRWIIIGVQDTTTTLSPLVWLAFLGLNGSSYLQQHLISFSPSFLSSSADNHLPGQQRHSSNGRYLIRKWYQTHKIAMSTAPKQLTTSWIQVAISLDDSVAHTHEEGTRTAAHPFGQYRQSQCQRDILPMRPVETPFAILWFALSQPPLPSTFTKSIRGHGNGHCHLLTLPPPPPPLPPSLPPAWLAPLTDAPSPFYSILNYKIISFTSLFHPWKKGKNETNKKKSWNYNKRRWAVYISNCLPPAPRRSLMQLQREVPRKIN